jgi:hypothetical protein
VAEDVVVAVEAAMSIKLRAKVVSTPVSAIRVSACVNPAGDPTNAGVEAAMLQAEVALTPVSVILVSAWVNPAVVITVAPRTSVGGIRMHSKQISSTTFCRNELIKKLIFSLRCCNSTLLLSLFTFICMPFNFKYALL